MRGLQNCLEYMPLCSEMKMVTSPGCGQLTWAAHAHSSSLKGTGREHTIPAPGAILEASLGHCPWIYRELSLKEEGVYLEIAGDGGRKGN